MSHIANKIVATDKALHSVLSETRYRIDTFQREYRWQHKQIDALISDLTSNFLANYEFGHSLEKVDSYDCYYMGPIVLCEDNGEMSVVDGQQRLTSFSLLLIYLQHLQKKLHLEDVEYRELNNYLFVSKGGRRTFCLDVPTRSEIMRRLHAMKTEWIDFEISTEGEKEKESITNLLKCYDDISHIFPAEIQNKEVLPLFIEWLVLKVVLVEIKAFSVDNAYTIFETMNDRGLSLNPTEILKAFILSKMNDDNRSEEMNEFWKTRISEIKYVAGTDSDLAFFRAWFRAKYARDINQGKPGNEKMDFEQIGSQFHTWVKNNHKLMHLNSPDDYYYFVKADFDFYSELFCSLIGAQKEETVEKESLYIAACYPMADSLCIPLFLSPILAADSKETIKHKYLIVNHFIDCYINRRVLSGKSVNQSTIRRPVFEIIKKIRNKSTDELIKILNDEITRYKTSDDAISANIGFAQSYMHYFYARVLYSLNMGDSFHSLLRSRKQSSYVITAIFKEEEWNQLNLGGKSNASPWSIFNYCICRRYDAYSMPQDLQKRINWLTEKGYLPEFKSQSIKLLEFTDKRVEILNNMVSQTIWPTNVDCVLSN